MNERPDRNNLIKQLEDARFSCEMCGECCAGPDNEVIVSPDEVEALSRASGLSFDEIAEPYPEWFEENGERFTFSWVLRRRADGRCMFLEQNRCRYYASRPHLCRTYPFMLNQGNLLISECPALGKSATKDAGNLADALILRQDADDAEFEATRREYQKHSIVSGKTLVIDSRGAHLLKE